MIVEELNVNAVSTDTPNIPSLKMRMSEKNASKLIPMLRDSLYSNKILAPIREYSTNARDEHIEHGIPNTPIQITLPSTFSPEFKVRDFGAGLTYEQIKNVYIEYCESTKTNNNDLNGCMGIGCKSAFTYSSSFILTSWCNGTKSIYQFLIDGNVIPMGEVPMSPDEKTGIEVVIPIALKDIDLFIEEALNFYKYWDIRPEILNVEQSVLDNYFKPINEKPIFFDDIWEIRPCGQYGYGKSVAVMGFVPYPINWDIVYNNMESNIRNNIYYIFSFLKSNNVIIRLPIGSIEFTPNREALQYSEKTLSVLKTAVVNIFDKIVDIITTKISTASNLWEAKIIYNKIFDASVLGKDYAEHSEFGGGVREIKRLVENNLKWNGIQLNDGIFKELYFWDADSGDLTGNYSRHGSYHYVLETYIKNECKRNSVEYKRCTRVKNNNIVCSPNSIILLNDIPKYSPRAAAASYTLYETHPTMDRVYILNLYNDEVKKKFFEHYKFDSVPVITISSILSKVKERIKINRIKNNSTTGGVVNVKPVYIPNISYLEIENLTSNYSNTPRETYWKTDTSVIKNISGGIYIEYERGTAKLGNGRSWDKYSLGYFVQNVWDFCQISNSKIDKIYGIPSRTINSKWFKKLIDSGTWINIKDFITSEINKIDKNTIQRVIDFANLDNNPYVNYIGVVAAEKIIPHIKNQNSSILEYCKDILVDIPEKFHIRNILRSMNLDGDFNTSVHDFKSACDKIKDKYPLIFKLDFNEKLKYNKKNMYGSLTDDNAKDIAHYVNLVDECESKKTVDIS